MPVKRLLDDFPSTWRFEQRKQIGHTNAGANHVAGPTGDLKTNDGDGFEDVHTNHSGLDLGSRTILVDPVEEELGSDSKLFPCVSEERGIGVECGTHKPAFALFASVNIKLHGIDDRVIFGGVFALSHGETVRTKIAGRQQPNVAKVGSQCEPGPKGRADR
jgi:hypothetical protein